MAEEEEGLELRDLTAHDNVDENIHNEGDLNQKLPKEQVTEPAPYEEVQPPSPPEYPDSASGKD